MELFQVTFSWMYCLLGKCQTSKFDVHIVCLSIGACDLQMLLPGATSESSLAEVGAECSSLVENTCGCEEVW